MAAKKKLTKRQREKVLEALWSKYDAAWQAVVGKTSRKRQERVERACVAYYKARERLG